MNRITELYSRLRPCRLFADIGCDHGFVAELAVKNGIAEKVYISDISAKCLAKAEKLLAVHIRTGTVESYVSDGFAAFEETPDQALIAGMGGEEIVRILSEAKELPERLVLQPMKNASAVRRFLTQNGYKLLEDVLRRHLRGARKRRTDTRRGVFRQNEPRNPSRSVFGKDRKRDRGHRRIPEKADERGKQGRTACP